MTGDAIQPGSMAEMDPSAMELVIRIIQANAESASHIGNQLVEAYKEQAERAEATIALIRSGIADLYDALWAPSQQAVFAALWPSSTAIDDQVKYKGMGSF